MTRVPTTVTTRGPRTVGEITCHIENPDGKLLPNVNVNVVVTTAQHQNALTVPREAVREDDGKRYVYEIIGDRLRRREVQTSLSSAMRVEITSGLSDNALVVLGATGRGALRDGAPVKVVQQ
jgi:HlyD family secretion protein